MIETRRLEEEEEEREGGREGGRGEETREKAADDDMALSYYDKIKILHKREKSSQRAPPFFVDGGSI